MRAYVRAPQNIIKYQQKSEDTSNPTPIELPSPSQDSDSMSFAYIRSPQNLDQYQQIQGNLSNRKLTVIFISR